MSQPYVGEIRMMANNFQVANWAFCNGSLQSIANNTVLFTLIGTTYGGDGVNTFALPDLLCRVPIHQGTLAGGSTYVIGQKAGIENVTLTTAQIPSHTHLVSASSTGGSDAPAGNYIAATTINAYSTNTQNQLMNTASVSNAGGNLPHTNSVPFLAINFLISLYGIFPSRN